MISTEAVSGKVIPVAVRVVSPGYEKEVNRTSEEVGHVSHLSTY